MIRLDNLSDNDSYSLLFVLMSKVTDNPTYSALSELSYILDKENFLRFITYYGGATIKVPTADEFHKAARVLVMYNCHVVQGLPFHESMEIAGYESNRGKLARKELEDITKVLTNYKSNKKDE